MKDAPLQHSLWWNRLLSLSVLFIGIIVLLGWTFDIEVLKRPIPDLVAMNPLTAICFVLTTLSLLLLSNPGKTILQNRTGLGLAYLVLALATLKLGGLIVGIDTHIDLWVFHSKLDTDIIGNVSNHMAPNTAFGFILTAIALLILQKQTRKNQVPSQYLGVIIAVVGMLSVLGYLFQVHAFYGFLKYFPMAIHTAICFLLLSIAILLVHSHKGIVGELSGHSFGAVTARRLIPAAIIIPVVLGLLARYSDTNRLMSDDLGDALLVLCIIILFILLIWYNARELNRDDKLRTEAEETVRKTLREVSAYKYALDEANIVAITDANGIIQHVNNNFCEISKYSRKELLGHDHRIINSRYHSKEYFQDLWKTISEGKTWNGEIRNRAKDGTIFWLHTSIVPFLDEQGHPYQYLTIRTDVTAQKEARETLSYLNQELEQRVKERTRDLASVVSRLRKAQEVAHLGSWELDFSTGVALWSDEACRIYGLDPETENQQSYESWLEFIHPDDLDRVLRSIKESEENLQDSAFYFRIVRKDGTIRHTYGETKLEFDESGKPVGLFGVSHDVTEIKQAEEALLKSRQRYKNLLDNMNDGFMVDDTGGKVTFANQAFLNIFGLEKEDIINLKLEDYVAPEYRDILRERHNQRVAGKSVPSYFEYQGLRKDGTKRWLGVRVNTVVEDGKIIGTQSVIRDITNSKRAEEKIKNQNSKLYEIAFLQSHQVRKPVSNLLGLAKLFNYNDPSDSANAEVLSRVEIVAKELDNVIREIVDKTNDIEGIK